MPKIKIAVTLKPALLDAQGRAVHSALSSLGYDNVKDVRIGRYIEVTLGEGADIDTQVREMCDKLLANPVIEDYRIEAVS